MQKMKNSNLQYYLVGVIFIMCTFTLWKIYHANQYLESKIEETLRELRKIKSEPLSISTRLQEAEDNWKRGLEARQKLEMANKLDQGDPWNFKHGISLWDFFYPNFDCPHSVERIGKSGDGGKWICGFGQLVKKPDPCVVYSYGVSDDTSFESEIVARTNCSVYLFDHTIKIGKVKLPQLYPERVFIEKVGLGVTDKKPLRSILSTMKKYGHSFIDILKIDVEGAEFAIFDNFKNDFPEGIPFGQVSMEIHLPVQQNDPNFYKKYKGWLTNLEDLGLRAFRNEFNLISVKRSAKHYPNLCEYSFLNVKYDHYLLH